jgi:hypothetical protein
LTLQGNGKCDRWKNDARVVFEDVVVTLEPRALRNQVSRNDRVVKLEAAP